MSNSQAAVIRKPKSMSAWFMAIAFILACAGHTPAANGQALQSKEHSFRVVRIVDGLDHPWGLAFLPDGRMLITERQGRLRIVKDQKLQPEPVQGLPAIEERGQGGLMDVVLHPNYATNGWIYLSYAAPGPGGIGTEVMRAKLVGNKLEESKLIFRMEPKSGRGLHFGSRLVFDRDGFLFITLGDRGDQDRAQRLSEHNGKIVRLRDDGSVPENNPFAKQAGARPDIFSLGNRNVQGAALHPSTGALWTHEHGPQGGDEINVIRAGVNYGWPVITYGRNYGTGTKIGEGTHKDGMAQPLHQWTPSIAPCGMAFYDGDKFPKWRGNLFVGSLSYQMLVRLRLDGEKVVEEERLLKDNGRVRDVRAGPDGYLYLLTDSSNGELLRLEPAK